MKTLSVSTKIPAQAGSKIWLQSLSLAPLLSSLALAFMAGPSQAQAPYNIGDVFAGIGHGKIAHHDSAGALIETLDTTSESNEDTGMCFDAAGNLYATNFSANNASKFDNAGALLLHPWGSGYDSSPESCVVDAAGHIYVGQADGTGDVLKFDAAGNLLASFDPDTEDRGSDWITLGADSCTLFYTSEGSSIKRFDVCANTQLPDFATGLDRPCFALRVRANGEVLTACSTKVYRLNPDGTVKTTYPIEGESLFALNLDPDGVHFWTAGLSTGRIYKVDIETGAGMGAPLFTSPVEVTLAGLAISGEPVGPVGNLNPCDGNPPEGAIVGTNVRNTLTGTPGDDIIFGLGGSDIIQGMGGNDIICGGPGTDYISGGSGNDRIFGGDGSDILGGGSGDDVLNGEKGSDTLNGGSGKDTLVGGDDLDVLLGVDFVNGNDTLDGGNGKNYCYADVGDTQSNCNPW